jgi:acetyl-CoA carboxylase carboxyl transferase subunit beta
MIDMVVHRHKMRETLSRICQLLTIGVAPPKSADYGKGKRLNGKPHINGSVVDAKLIGPVSRTTNAPVIEPEILGPEERFDPARVETRDKQRKDDDTGPTRSISKDRQH